ncbi:MAG: hypothetical protein IPM29_24170 [Planctomycetes bacterium]|nr:hypothetical protein [Planctomycetota bacterium]
MNCRIALSFVAMACAANAQVTMRATAATTLRVAVGSTTRTIPAGADLTAGASISVSQLAGGSCPPGAGSGAGASVAITAGASGPRCTFSNQAWENGSGFFCGVAPSTAGAHDVLVTLTAPQPTAGALRVSARGSNGRWFSIDIGNDGSAELVDQGDTLVTQEYEVPILIDSTGVGVRLSASAVNQSGLFWSTGSATLAVEFLQSGGRLTRIGAPCGVDLTGHYELIDPFFSTGVERFVFQGSNAPPWPAAFFVIGTTDTWLPIPPSNCPFRTDLLIPVFVTLNPAGQAAVTLNVPAGFVRTDFRIQFLVGMAQGGLEYWNMSEALRVRYP